MCSMADKTDSARVLKYNAELQPLSDYIQASYSESTVCVFRSVISVPPTEVDATPQSKRLVPERGDELDLPLTQEDVEEMTEAEKKEFVADLAISVFVSKEKAEKNVINMVRHIAKASSHNEAKVYLEEKRGAYIVKVQLSPEVGMLENRFNKKGHANLLLYEDVDIKDHIVEVYSPMRFEDIVE